MSTVGTETTCPAGCSCDSNKTLICRNIDRIPDYDDKGIIEDLLIYDHNITQLRGGDLKGFGGLKKLDISGGTLQTLWNGTFDDIKDTVVVICLSRNDITEIPPRLFKDIPNLHLINLTKNGITMIRNETFVNLAELRNLFLELNKISLIEDGALKNIPNLDNIDLFSNKLDYVPVNALKSATTFRKLDISFNNISELPEDLSGQMVSLEELDLESNPISSMTIFPNISPSLKILNLQFTDLPKIETNAWRNIPKLEKLYMSGNLFEELSYEMFAGLDTVDTIFLMSLPHLTRIGPNTFSNLMNLNELHLSFNQKLTYIDDSAFTSTNMSYVHLKENNLSTVHETLLNWTSLRFFTLVGNPINCDCRITWMFKPEYKSVRSNFSDIVCALPSKYLGKKLLKLEKSDLKCGKTDKERLATGIVVAVFCFSFMTLFFILFRCRKRINMRCRRYFMYKRYQNDLVFTVEKDTSIGELDDGDTRPLKELRLETSQMSE